METKSKTFIIKQWDIVICTNKEKSRFYRQWENDIENGLFIYKTDKESADELCSELNEVYESNFEVYEI